MTNTLGAVQNKLYKRIDIRSDEHEVWLKNSLNLNTCKDHIKLLKGLILYRKKQDIKMEYVFDEICKFSYFNIFFDHNKQQVKTLVEDVYRNDYKNEFDLGLVPTVLDCSQYLKERGFSRDSAFNWVINVYKNIVPDEVSIMELNDLVEDRVQTIYGCVC